MHKLIALSPTIRTQSRVEKWRGGLGRAYRLPALSSAGASVARPCSVSTSRSSNRTGGFPATTARAAVPALGQGGSCVRPREVACDVREPDQSQCLVQVLVGEACRSRSLLLVFLTQPPAEPRRDVAIHGTVGLADPTPGGSNSPSRASGDSGVLRQPRRRATCNVERFAR